MISALVHQYPNEYVKPPVQDVNHGLRHNHCFDSFPRNQFFVLCRIIYSSHGPHIAGWHSFPFSYGHSRVIYMQTGYLSIRHLPPPICKLFILPPLSAVSPFMSYRSCDSCHQCTLTRPRHLHSWSRSTLFVDSWFFLPQSAHRSH